MSISGQKTRRPDKTCYGLPEIFNRMVKNRLVFTGLDYPKNNSDVQYIYIEDFSGSKKS